jgi:hypothetical protein
MAARRLGALMEKKFTKLQITAILVMNLVQIKSIRISLEDNEEGILLLFRLLGSARIL